MGRQEQPPAGKGRSDLRPSLSHSGPHPTLGSFRKGKECSLQALPFHLCSAEQKGRLGLPEEKPVSPKTLEP